MEGFGGEWDFCDSIVLVLVILKKFVIYWSAEPRRLGIGTVERWSSFGGKKDYTQSPNLEACGFSV